jgi:hypothetical protein
MPVADEILALYNPLGNPKSARIMEHKRTLAAKLTAQYNKSKLDDGLS